MTSVPIYNAAKRLKIHPFQLLMIAVEHDKTLDNYWPQIDEHLLLTVEAWAGKSQHRERVQTPPRGDTTPEEVLSGMGISNEMARIVSGLARDNHWSKSRVPLEKIIRHYSKTGDHKAVKDDLRELVRLGIVKAKSPHGGAYALDLEAKAKIDTICRAYEGLRTAGTSQPS